MGPLFKDTSGFMVFLTVLILASRHCASSESHSLSLLATFICGETPFPELTLVLTVNNVPVEYYDSNIKKIVSQRHWSPNDSVEDTERKYFVVEETHRSMKYATDLMMKHFNHTNVTGIRVYQKFAACELEGGKLSRFFFQDAYEGEETRTYDILEQKYNPRVPELIWTKLKMEDEKLICINVYQPLCLKVLRQYLQQDKNVLMRRERPRVRVIQKRDPGTGGAQVCCLATGFFPRHINMTLLRDSQPLPEQDLTGGEVLPNGDGTFQMRKSLSVSEQQLREKHLYICTVTHLDRKEDFGLAESEDRPDVILITVLVVTVLAVIVLVVAIILYRRRHNGPPDPCQTSATARYTAAQKTEQSDFTSIFSSS